MTAVNPGSLSRASGQAGARAALASGQRTASRADPASIAGISKSLTSLRQADPTGYLALLAQLVATGTTRERDAVVLLSLAVEELLPTLSLAQKQELLPFLQIAYRTAHSESAKSAIEPLLRRLLNEGGPPPRAEVSRYIEVSTDTREWRALRDKDPVKWVGELMKYLRKEGASPLACAQWMVDAFRHVAKTTSLKDRQREVSLAVLTNRAVAAYNRESDVLARRTLAVLLDWLETLPANASATRQGEAAKRPQKNMTREMAWEALDYFVPLKRPRGDGRSGHHIDWELNDAWLEYHGLDPLVLHPAVTPGFARDGQWDIRAARYARLQGLTWEKALWLWRDSAPLPAGGRFPGGGGRASTPATASPRASTPSPTPARFVDPTLDAFLGTPRWNQFAEARIGGYQGSFSDYVGGVRLNARLAPGGRLNAAYDSPPSR